MWGDLSTEEDYLVRKSSQLGLQIEAHSVLTKHEHDGHQEQNHDALQLFYVLRQLKNKTTRMKRQLPPQKEESKPLRLHTQKSLNKIHLFLWWRTKPQLYHRVIRVCNTKGRLEMSTHCLRRRGDRH